MTHPDPKVQALLNAIDKAAKTHCIPLIISNARKALEPKPEMEKVLPDEMPELWESMAEWIWNGDEEGDKIPPKVIWTELVILTSRPAKKVELKSFEELSADAKANWIAFAKIRSVLDYDTIITQLRSMDVETP